MADYKTKILIIGSGPAGYTAGIYAARAGLKPLLVSGNQPGGQLTMTTSIENFPGFKDPQDGTMLMETMKEQALALGVEMINDRITSVDTSKRPFICESENNNHYEKENTHRVFIEALFRRHTLECNQHPIGTSKMVCRQCYTI